MNSPVRNLHDINGNILFNEDGSKQTVGDHISTSDNRRERRAWLQKMMRNPFYGIHINRYIQVVPETTKTEEGIVEKLGRILSKGKRGYEFTGKVKVIDHYPYKTR